jgi:integrase
MDSIGRVRSRERHHKRSGKIVDVYFLDFSPHLKGPDRFLYGDRGIGFEGPGEAEHTLRGIRIDAARVGLSEAVALRRKPERRPNLVTTHAAQWLEEKAEDCAPYTVNGYRTIVRHHLDFWDGRIVREVTTAGLKEWIGHLTRKGLSVKTINGIALVVMRGLLKHAREADPTLLTLEIPKAKRRGPKPKRQRMPLPDILQTLLKIRQEDRGIFMHMFYTMNRPGEARAALIEDYDFDTGTFETCRALKTGSGVNPVEGTTKTDEDGACTLPADLRVWLAEHARWRRNRPEAPLYANPRTEAAYRMGTLTDMWRNATEAADVPYVSLYRALKHSPGTALLEAGVPIGDLQAAYRHTTAAMTEAYDLEKRMRRERAMRRLEELAGVALAELMAAESESANNLPTAENPLSCPSVAGQPENVVGVNGFEPLTLSV